jgi:hypothetical protein
MRIQRSRAVTLPRAADLRSAFVQQLEDAGATTLEEREDEEGVLWRARLEPSANRPARGTTVMLAARRLASEIILCASIPGASDDEVESAARACEGVRP